MVPLLDFWAFLLINRLIEEELICNLHIKEPHDSKKSSFTPILKVFLCILLTGCARCPRPFRIMGQGISSSLGCSAGSFGCFSKQNKLMVLLHAWLIILCIFLLFYLHFLQALVAAHCGFLFFPWTACSCLHNPASKAHCILNDIKLCLILQATSNVSH